MNLNVSTEQVRIELSQRLSDLFGDVILLDFLLFGEADEASVYPLASDEIRHMLHRRVGDFLTDDIQELSRLSQILLAHYGVTESAPGQMRCGKLHGGYFPLRVIFRR